MPEHNVTDRMVRMMAKVARKREDAQRRKAAAVPPVKRKKSAYVRDKRWRHEIEDEAGWRDRPTPPARRRVKVDQDTVVGVICEAYPGTALVRVGDEVWRCTFRGTLLSPTDYATNLACVGDEVRVSVGQHRIVELLPRRTCLLRAAVGGARGVQALAANVDQLAIVAALREPPLRRGLLDRYLAAAELGAIQPLIVATKSDLASEDDREALRVYRALGYTVLEMCAPHGQGLCDLRERLRGKRTVLAGHSGVGKTTLLNALAPQSQAATRSISSSTGKGVHTTTAARLVVLDGAEIIDTAGVREFGLAGVRLAGLASLFVELRALGGACRPRCLHAGEDGCAVPLAIAEGSVDGERYASYRRILESLLDSSSG